MFGKRERRCDLHTKSSIVLDFWRGRGGSAIDNPEVPDSFALSLESPKKAKVKKSRSREPSPARRMPVDPS